MSVLFERSAQIQIGTLLLDTHGGDNPVKDSLRFVFSVKSNSDKGANKASIDIYNLTKDNRGRLSELDPEANPVIIKAGYVDSVRILFQGTILSLAHRRDGANWRTTLKAQDGGKAFRTARIAKSYVPGTPISTVAKDLAEAAGIGIGNLETRLAAGNVNPGSPIEFVDGFAAFGNPLDVLFRLLVSLGFEASVQQEKLQVLGPTEAKAEAVVLSSSTGLIGAFETGFDTAKKKTDKTATKRALAKGTSLLNGLIQPGVRLRVLLGNIIRDYKTDSVVHSGDTWGQEWATAFDARPL